MTTEKTWKTYSITSKTSGAEVWRGDAVSAERALWAMARDAGYSSHEEACKASGGDGSDLVVKEVGSLREDAKVIVAVIAGEETALLVVAEEDKQLVYGAEDWRDQTSPSFDYDEDGDLRAHNGERCYGDAIAVVRRSPEEAEALLRRTWENQEGVFRG